VKHHTGSPARPVEFVNIEKEENKQ